MRTIIRTVVKEAFGGAKDAFVIFLGILHTSICARNVETGTVTVTTRTSTA